MKRFFDKVDSVGAAGTCHMWTRGLDRRGYGRFQLLGKARGAHRVAWQLAHPEADAGSQCVLHSCDNPACVNPAHLFLGTQLDNIRDMDNKGRRVPAHGEKHGRAKLKAEDVLVIRDARAHGVTYSSLASVYGVSIQNVHMAAVGKHWASVGPPK